LNEPTTKTSRASGWKNPKRTLRSSGEVEIRGASEEPAGGIEMTSRRVERDSVVAGAALDLVWAAALLAPFCLGGL
jgi:hypothetical protein